MHEIINSTKRKLLMNIHIDTFLTPFFPEPESLFDNSIVVMIDVLRASSTVAMALSNGAKEVIPADSLEKAVKIFGSLSREVRFLGGERNAVMPSGFDAGNSPFEYTSNNVAGKSVILTTTNGARIFLKARNVKYKIICGFVNIGLVSNFIISKLANVDEKLNKVQILCAGNDGNLSYEDSLCAGMLIDNILNSDNDYILSDSSFAAHNLYEANSGDLQTMLKVREHASKLSKLGFEKDIDYCLSINSCPVLPIMDNSSIKKIDFPKL